MGRAKIRISVTTFGTAFPMNDAFKSRHVPVVIVGFHALGIVVHWKMQTQIIAMAQPTTSDPRKMEPILTERISANARQYIRRREIFTMATVST
jgi:hypothetical protein